MKKPFLLAVFLLIASVASASIIYVDSSCSTNGNGSTTTCGASGPKNAFPTPLVTGNTYSFNNNGATYTITANRIVPSNVTVNTYGTGTKPTFAWSTATSGYTKYVFTINDGSNISIGGFKWALNNTLGIYVAPTANISSLSFPDNDWTITRGDDQGQVAAIWYQGSQTFTTHDFSVTGNTATANNTAMATCRTYGSNQTTCEAAGCTFDTQNGRNICSAYTSAIVRIFPQAQTYNWTFTKNTFSNVNEFFGVQFVEANCAGKNQTSCNSDSTCTWTGSVCQDWVITNNTYPYGVVFDHNTCTNCTRPPIDYVGVADAAGHAGAQANSTSYNNFNHIGNVLGATTYNVNPFQLGFIVNMLVEGNTCNDVTTNEPDGACFEIDFLYDQTNVNLRSHNNTIRWNVASGAEAGIQSFSGDNNLIYGNVAYNNTVGFSTMRYGAGNMFYNNVAYNNGTGLYADYQTQGVHFWRNNISYNNTTDFKVFSGVTAPVEDHNDLVTTSGFTHSATDLHNNPLFVNAAINDFHLQAGSTMIGPGINYGYLDPDGNAIGPNIGAYGWSAVPPEPPALGGGFGIDKANLGKMTIN